MYPNGTKYDFNIKRNDSLPALGVKISDQGCLGQQRNYTLSGVTAVTFTMIDECENPKILSQPTQITCYSGGSMQYNWQSGDTDTSGVFSGEFCLYYSDGNKMSIPPIGGITIRIFDDIDSF